MYKKISAFVCACIMVLLCFAGCTEKNNSNADVHVFYYTYSDTYISGVRNALDKALTDAGISYQDYDGNSNQTTQTEQIQTAITKGAKAILVNIVNTGSDDAANGIVKLAKEKGIPVVFFNREVSDSVIKGYDKCAFVGTKAEEAGILQGEMIGVVWKHYHKKGELAEGQAEIRFLDNLKSKYGTWRRVFVNGQRIMYDKLESELKEKGTVTKVLDSQKSK